MKDWIKLHSGFSAGAWFGATGLLISQIIFIAFYHKPLAWAYLPEELIPVAASIVCGAWLGRKIIATPGSQSKYFSVKHGIMTMYTSFLLYCLFISIMTSVLSKDVQYGLAILFEFILIGSIAFGWLIVIGGGISGRLLSSVVNRIA